MVLVPKVMWCQVLGGIKYVLSCSSLWNFILKVLVARMKFLVEFVAKLVVVVFGLVIGGE